MEAEWRVYLKEHAPELYKDMLAEVCWAAEWRDTKIKDTVALLQRANDQLKELKSSLDLGMCECDDAECFCGAKGLTTLLSDIEKQLG